MSNIIVLPEYLANKIAAGEVVERPASVVKELVENAIDAKSSRILISVLEGGIRLILVQDDGEGMSREAAELAFFRHATSKISKEEDLRSIATFGFRGEALPSIASISNIRLVTQVSDSDVGSELVLSAGSIKQFREIGAPKGSTFEVSDLFYNTPARKKFLKSPSTELSHIRNVVFQLALAHPEIFFQLTHQGKTLLSAPAVLTQKDRLLQLYGNEVLNSCIEEHRSFEEGALAIDLFFSGVPLLKSRSKDQILFVNRRPVKSPLISHAVHDAYGSFLVKGDHPFFVLYLSIDLARVDVNVHPTKKEVRFQNTEEVYRSVKKTIRERLEGSTVAIPGAGGTRIPVGGVSPYGHSNCKPGERTSVREKDVSSSSDSTWLGWPESKQKEGGIASVTGMKPAEAGDILSQTEPTSKSVGLFPSRTFIRPIGQIYGTFLLAEIDDEFVVIDQHTAHERILYEAFLKKWNGTGPVAVQPLLIPRQIDLTPPQAVLIREGLNLFQEIGLEMESFGERTFLIRSVPIELSGTDLELFLIDLSDDLAEVGVMKNLDQPRLTMIASMACHAAIRANQSLRLDEMEALLRDFFDRNTPLTCPHGRPVIIKYPLSELEKLFRRR